MNESWYRSDRFAVGTDASQWKPVCLTRSGPWPSRAIVRKRRAEVRPGKTPGGGAASDTTAGRRVKTLAGTPSVALLARLLRVGLFFP